MADPVSPHVVLVGLPGSGKSTVGARLARQLGRDFLDFDVEISRRQAMSITDIFTQKGEPFFRALEHDLTEELRHQENMILAPGGGWVTRPETVALLRPPAALVYLRLSAGAALRRMGSKVDGRPLLQRPDPRGELERLFAVRRSIYESAEFVVDVEHLYPQRVTEQIIAQLGVGRRGSARPDSAGG
ncbi:MAG: shikimate kinase [bacterium]